MIRRREDSRDIDDTLLGPCLPVPARQTSAKKELDQEEVITATDIAVERREGIIESHLSLASALGLQTDTHQLGPERQGRSVSYVTRSNTPAVTLGPLQTP